jgi:hypothetical protein
MNSFHSGHFNSYEFYAKKKEIIKSDNVLPIILNLRPLSLNLTFCYLTVEQKVILPDYVLKVEKQMDEKREIAISLRNEVRKDIGLSPGSTPIIGNSGESIKIKSRSGSLENITGLKKNVSFKEVSIDELTKDSQSTVEYSDSNSRY